MKNLIEKTFLKETIEFNGSINELKELIRFKRDRKFKLEWISNNEFKVLAKLSMGTIMLDFNPGYFDGIKGFGKLTELDNGKTRIDLTTKLRVEMYLIVFLFFIFLFAFLISDENIPIWIFSIFPIMIVWFWFVYRIQEKLLFDKVKRYIKFDLKTQYNKSYKQ